MGSSLKEAEGQTRLADETRGGRPAIAVTPGNIQQVDDIIRGDCRVKTDELCRILSFSKGSVITSFNTEEEKIQNCAISRESYGVCLLGC